MAKKRIAKAVKSVLVPSSGAVRRSVWPDPPAEKIPLDSVTYADLLAQTEAWWEDCVHNGTNGDFVGLCYQPAISTLIERFPETVEEGEYCIMFCCLYGNPEIILDDTAKCFFEDMFVEV